MQNLAILLFVAVSWTNTLAQSGESVILEAVETGVGMAANSGKYLFVRVRENGSLEYEEFTFENGRRMTEREAYMLAPLQLDYLKSLLKKVASDSVQSAFEPDASPLDHLVSLDVRISVESRNKSIRLLNFSPGLSRDSDKYPNSILELHCAMRSFRNRTTFTMLGDECILKPQQRSTSP